MSRLCALIIATLTVLCITFAVLWFNTPIMSAPEYETEISMPEVDATVFVKRVVTGFAGGRQLTFVTADRKDGTHYDPNTDYYYRTFHRLRYRVDRDTLFLYSDVVSNVPKTFDGRIHVVQVYINNDSLYRFYDSASNLKMVN